MSDIRGWHERGYLPHFDGGQIYQFVTIHLGDALPKAVIDRWKSELAGEDDLERRMQLYRRMERYIDNGYGACSLNNREIAHMVRSALVHFDCDRYELIAWVIMPNHIHVLLLPAAGVRLEDIIHSLKSYTALRANRLLGRSGKFWQEEYYDRFIRNYDHYQKTLDYIEMNPVRAGLCKRPEDWRWSSAFTGGQDARAPSDAN